MSRTDPVNDISNSMDAAVLSSSSEEEDEDEEVFECTAFPSPTQQDTSPIDWGEVFRHSRHCESARNAGRRRRCREESRRLHPYRFTDSDEDFTETTDDWLHRKYAGTKYCPCHTCVTTKLLATAERMANCRCTRCESARPY